jgi:gamma-tubulin complex component 3
MRDRARRPPPKINGVVVEGEDGDLSQHAQSLWDRKFGFRIEMLPSFLDEAFGRKVREPLEAIIPGLAKVSAQIFSTGKSLNFLKYSCDDDSWVAERSKSGSNGKGARLNDTLASCDTDVASQPSSIATSQASSGPSTMPIRSPVSASSRSSSANFAFSITLSPSRTTFCSAAATLSRS